MEICRPGNITDVPVNRESAVKNNIQTLNLGGEGGTKELSVVEGTVDFEYGGFSADE